MNKYLKIILILIFSLATLSIVPIIIINKVVLINKKIKTNIRSKYIEKLNDTFDFTKFKKILDDKKKNFILYIGGDFCSQCKKINEKLEEKENKKIKDLVLKDFYFKEFEAETETFKKDFRNETQSQWRDFWNKVLKEYPKAKEYNWKMAVPFFLFFEFNNKTSKYKIKWMGNLNFQSLERKIDAIWNDNESTDNQ